MLPVKYYLISPQYVSVFYCLYLHCLNCSTFVVPQVPMCEKKTKFKIQNLKFIMYIASNKVSHVQLI